MSLAYSVLRNRVLPSLLQRRGGEFQGVLSHRTFEAGEVAVLDGSANMGTRTDLNLRPYRPSDANFSEMHSTLDVLLYYLGVEYRLEPAENPLFLREMRESHNQGWPRSGISAR